VQSFLINGSWMHFLTKKNNRRSREQIIAKQKLNQSKVIFENDV